MAEPPTDLARIYEEHFDFVWRLVRRLGIDPSGADDAAQQVFVIAANKLHTAEQVTHFTKAGGGCGGCIPRIKELIAEVLGEQTEEVRKKPEKLTNLRKMQLIQDVLEKEVRPQLWADGGDLELIDIDGARVQVAFRKACAGCVSSGYTAKFVEQKLRDLVADDITVEEVEG